MKDPNRIGTLYPLGGAWKQNVTETVEPTPPQNVPPQLDIPPDPIPDELDLDISYDQRVQLTFDNGPRTNLGFVFGWDPDCDIVLPRINGISFHHGALTFDAHQRLIYRDFGSLRGTQVTYSDRGKGWRSNFQWIVGGHRFLSDEKKIIIHFRQMISFLIVVHRESFSLPLLADNIHHFRQGTLDPETHIAELDLEQPSTVPGRSTHALGTGPIAIVRELNSGAFGVVKHTWDVSSGEERAIKEPSIRSIQRDQFDIKSWRAEADILGRLSHPHIVKLLNAEFQPNPRLCLEYMAGGSLWGHKNVTPRECLEILRQCLSALDYLHGFAPPIAHQDISPGNILVHFRDRNNIHVKLSDFGFTREDDDLKTICGTPRFSAPELQYDWVSEGYGSGVSYTSKVDIWSLGMVVYSILYKLPKCNVKGVRMCQLFANLVHNDYTKNPSGLSHLLTLMLVMDPRRRISANDAYKCALRVEPLEDTSYTPTVDDSFQSRTQSNSAVALDQVQATVRPLVRPASSRVSRLKVLTTGGSPSLASTIADKHGVKRTSKSTVSRGRQRGDSRTLPSLTSSHSMTESESDSTFRKSLLSILYNPFDSLGGGSDLAPQLRREDLNRSDTQASSSHQSSICSARETCAQDHELPHTPSKSHGVKAGCIEGSKC